MPDARQVARVIANATFAARQCWLQCPLDEINRPRASVDAQLRIPPTVDEVEQLFAGWRGERGRFGKLTVRHGKGSRRKGPKARLVPLINGADRGLCWYIEDVLGLFDIDPAGHSVPLFPSERRNTDGACLRATADVFRRSLAEVAERHLPVY